MREIKFRAWNIKETQMARGITLNETPLLNVDFATIGPNIILMQFTGLLDKSGKEIYEGDIVRDCSHTDLVFAVEWNNEHIGYWMPPEFDEEYEYPISEVILELIGNIYENPDLLTV